MGDLINTASPRELISLLSRYKLKPHKGLGQNFLIDGNIIQKIIAAADLNPGDAVMEIGPGAGSLTLALALRQARVLALELDQGFVNLLKDQLRPFAQVSVIHGDALKADYGKLSALYFNSGDTVKLVSNLPYYISSPLIYRIIEQRFPFSCAVLMLQKEMTQRVLAKPGDSVYGSLSVLCQYYTFGKHLFNVSRNVFWPRPDVESAVITLKPRSPILEPDEEALLRQIVRTAFQHRRKTLINSLSLGFSWPKMIMAPLIMEASVDPECRPETLSVGQFAKLARIIYNYRRSENGV
ncbi:MAG: ribosomal RNA small subunit methyltransferase A [Dethiobacter sp.]|nr:ribosomal RNA small subunit methyltransferase A [Dethiobacter sp.]